PRAAVENLLLRHGPAQSYAVKDLGGDFPRGKPALGGVGGQDARVQVADAALPFDEGAAPVPAVRDEHVLQGHDVSSSAALSMAERGERSTRGARTRKPAGTPAGWFGLLRGGYPA